MKNRLFSRRSINCITALLCAGLLAFAYVYLENTLFLTPCPLCYAQRIVFAMVACCAVFAAVFPAGRVGGWVYGALIALLATGGAALSLQHVYLQSTASHGVTAACGQDFYALLESAPISQTIFTMLTGSGDCGIVQWTWLGLSIPAWSLVAFVGVGIVCLWNNAFRKANKN